MAFRGRFSTSRARSHPLAARLLQCTSSCAALQCVPSLWISRRCQLVCTHVRYPFRFSQEPPPPGVARDAAQAHRTAMQLAGGTHHAFRGHGEGFCCFNDIAVAAEAAIHAYGADAVPILVIDLDVHQGNGTAKIFEGRSDVITFSMHGANNYPWRSKMRSTYDVDLPDETDDATYLALLDEWLPRLFATHAPRLVFYQAGVDALKGDKMGRLAMTRAGLARRNHAVFSACLAAGVPCVTVMGGGYAPDEASIDAHADVFRAAALRFSVA